MEPGSYTACLDVIEAAFDTGRQQVGHGERCVVVTWLRRVFAS